MWYPGRKKGFHKESTQGVQKNLKCTNQLFPAEQAQVKRNAWNNVFEHQVDQNPMTLSAHLICNMWREAITTSHTLSSGTVWNLVRTALAPR